MPLYYGTMSKFVEGRAFKTMGCRPQHEQLRRLQDMNGWVGGHVHRASEGGNNNMHARLWI